MEFLFPVSRALDIVEHDATGAEPGHGRRVACMLALMALRLDATHDELEDLVACALLHDNAVAEFERNERDARSRGDRFMMVARNGAHVSGVDTHVLLGEKNVAPLPFHGDVKDVVLAHHERADGTGPLGLSPSQVDFRSKILHLVDRIDVNFDLATLSKDGFDELRNWVVLNEDKAFSREIVSCFKDKVTFEDVQLFQERGAQGALEDALSFEPKDYSAQQVGAVAGFVVRIVDWKSSYTKDHSVGVANKARAMAAHYKWDDDKTLRFSFAGALHDIGKLILPDETLNKPTRLNNQEFEVMEQHVIATRKMLQGIEGLEDVCTWAANHHEKLDGSGYPRGLTARDLSFEDRVLACVDIYQALTETRPYKEGFSHEQTMEIMRDMAREGKIDSGVVEDVDKVFASISSERQPVAVRR
jgi:HD-GYP domain-containing protein (c-di-GMP phosphodiesterase class II)